MEGEDEDIGSEEPLNETNDVVSSVANCSMG